ncbi:nitronate monooxygenase [Psychromicrobium lacuslunae]|nr:nitronate monooxygenase [Psychromicrobium lacuslunae]
MFDSNLIVAPMAGGPSTPELVVAAAESGAIGFLAAGYKSVDALATQISAVRQSTENFGVNLFVPDQRPVDQGALAAYRVELQTEASRYRVELPELAGPDDDAWSEKLDLLTAQPPRFVSFTFGLPSSRVLSTLQRQGSLVLATVTSAEEAQQATELGVDALVLQHPDAGGHSAAFLDLEATPWSGSLHGLLKAVRQLSSLPLVAAGGIADSAAVSGSLQAGASAVQLGTAFLKAKEAGTKEVHRSALDDRRFGRTARTRAFSGRWARGLENRFIREHSGAPSGYPQIHHLTSELRSAAAAQGDADGVNLWAGTGYSLARTATSAEIIAELSRQI